MMLMVASSMLRLGLPHVNVLTKIDLLPIYGKLPFNMDFFLGGGGVEVSRLMRLVIIIMHGQYTLLLMVKIKNWAL